MPDVTPSGQGSQSSTLDRPAAELRIVITEANFGSRVVDQGLPGDLCATVTVEPFTLSDEQRQLRRTALNAGEIEQGEPELTPALRDALGDAHVLIGQDFPLSLPTLAPQLRMVQVLSSGTEHLRLCGIPRAVSCANAAGISAESVAEWVLAQTLAHLKHLRLHDAQQRARQWIPQHGRRLRGRNVAVVGFGAIGREVARMFVLHGAQVTGIRRSALPPDLDGVTLESPERLHEVLRTADIVIGALPDTAQTSRLFGAEAFELMGPAALFINVGRGNTVDEDALRAALTDGRLGAACVDVLVEEPLRESSPLWDTRNLVISPHSAVSFEGYSDAAFDLIVDNLTRLRDHRPLRNGVEI